MSKLVCPKNRILFQFHQGTEAGSFNNRTNWGFEIKNAAQDIGRSRWAKVCVVGKDVTKVKPGQYIYIENMMWTLSFTHEGTKYWATNETKVELVSDVEPPVEA